MSQYIYPQLKRNDIVASLIENEIAAITEQDIIHPKPDFLMDLYTRILVSIDFYHEEDLQPNFDGLNPALHVNSFQSLNLCNRLKRVLIELDCPYDFTFKDLLKPDPKRTELFLSALVNFYLYKSTKMSLLNKAMGQISESIRHQEWLEDHVSQLNIEIAKINEARGKDLPLVQEVDAKVKELRQTIEGLNNDQVKLRNSHKRLKEKTVERDKEISEADFDLLKCDSKRQELRSKIVQSPHKLQRALEEKQLVREKAKNDEMSAMRTFEDKNAVDEVYTKVSKKLSKHLAQMQAIQEQVNSAKDAGKEHRAVKDKISDYEVVSKSLQAELVKRKTQFKDLNDGVQKLEKEQELKFEKATQEFNNVKLDVESKRGALEARKKDTEAAVAEVDSIAANIASVRQSGEAEQHELARKCEEFMKEFQEYSNSIGVLVQTESQNLNERGADIC